MRFVLRVLGFFIIALGLLASFLANDQGNDHAIIGGFIMAAIGGVVALAGGLFKSRTGS